MNLDDPRALVEQQLHTLVGKVLEGHRSAEVDAELRKAGFDPDETRPQRLEGPAWKRVMGVTASAAFPTLSTDEAQRALGERLIEVARTTGWGKALFGLAKLLGPRRALERMTQALGQHGATRLDEHGDTDLELWMRQAPVSVGFAEGLLTAGLRAVGAGELDLRRSGNAKEGYTFVIRWEAD